MLKNFIRTPTPQNPSLNQQSVLQEFYQQRKRRASANSTKRHTLLQKNSSYFTTTNLNKTTPSFNITITQTNQQGLTGAQPTLLDKPYQTPKPVYSAIKQQINSRSRSISQAEILSKYTSLSPQPWQNLPINPLTSSIARSSTTTTDNTKIKKDLSASANGFGSGQPRGRNYGHGDRKMSLNQLENNFRVLTGQEPGAAFRKPDSKKVYEQDIGIAGKQNNQQPMKPSSKSLREQLKGFIPNIPILTNITNNPNSNSRKTDPKNPPSSQPSIKDSPKTTTTPATPIVHHMSDNIKIINKVQNSKQKQKYNRNYHSHNNMPPLTSNWQEQQQSQPLLVLAHRHSQNINIQNQKNHQVTMQQVEQSNYYMESPNFRVHCQEQSAESKNINNNNDENGRSRVSNSFNQDSRYVDDKDVKRASNFQEHKHNQLKQAQKQKEIAALKLKIEQLQKLTKKQNKFILSVQSMRKTIDKTQSDCNLKQLWRWVKSLGNRSNS